MKRITIEGQDFTPLAIAKQKGNTQIIGLLEKAGAKENSISIIGTDPMIDKSINPWENLMVKKLTKVDSSMVYAVGYDRDSKTLEVVFRRGGIWEYKGIPEKEEVVGSALMK